jgi:hypothetical protein
MNTPCPLSRQHELCHGHRVTNEASLVASGGWYIDKGEGGHGSPC